jgi:hypothetical protein
MLLSSRYQTRICKALSFDFESMGEARISAELEMEQILSRDNISS